MKLNLNHYTLKIEEQDVIQQDVIQQHKAGYLLVTLILLTWPVYLLFTPYLITIRHYEPLFIVAWSAYILTIGLFDVVNKLFLFD